MAPLLNRVHDAKATTYLHPDGRLQVQALPVNARPPVEQLRHEGDVVQMGPASDVAGTDERSQPDPLGTRDHKTRAAERYPLGIPVRRIAIFALEVVVQLLRHRRRQKNTEKDTTKEGERAVKARFAAFHPCMLHVIKNYEPMFPVALPPECLDSAVYTGAMSV